MQLIVMRSAQRYHKQVMRFGTHSTLPVAYQVVGVVCRVIAATALLRLHPAGVLLIFPASALWPQHERFRRFRIDLHRHYLFCLLLKDLRIQRTPFAVKRD